MASSTTLCINFTRNGNTIKANYPFCLKIEIYFTYLVLPSIIVTHAKGGVTDLPNVLIVFRNV